MRLDENKAARVPVCLHSLYWAEYIYFPLDLFFFHQKEGDLS